MCSYVANKQNFSLESVSGNHKVDYKKALLEVEKSSEVEIVSNKVKTLSPAISNKTPKQNNSAISNISQSITMHDGSVENPKDIDLKYQLNSLKEKCVSLTALLEGKIKKLMTFTSKYLKKN